MVPISGSVTHRSSARQRGNGAREVSLGTTDSRVWGGELTRAQTSRVVPVNCVSHLLMTFWTDLGQGCSTYAEFSTNVLSLPTLICHVSDALVWRKGMV